ncbi:MAG: hypothetical protein PHC61_13005, partial [Chitinivibrionales bacterium]|nr:hypothetical protein [Chitinivibrionales bacterium]
MRRAKAALTPGARRPRVLLTGLPRPAPFWGLIFLLANMPAHAGSFQSGLFATYSEASAGKLILTDSLRLKDSSWQATCVFGPTQLNTAGGKGRSPAVACFGQDTFDFFWADSFKFTNGISYDHIHRNELTVGDGAYQQGFNGILPGVGNAGGNLGLHVDFLRVAKGPLSYLVTVVDHNYAGPVRGFYADKTSDATVGLFDVAASSYYAALCAFSADTFLVALAKDQKNITAYKVVANAGGVTRDTTKPQSRFVAATITPSGNNRLLS